MLWKKLKKSTRDEYAKLSLRVGRKSFAVMLAGFTGINSYTLGSYVCGYQDRGGASYVKNLQRELEYAGHLTSFAYHDDQAWESRLSGASAPANRVDFFAFSGHGFDYTKYGSTLGPVAASHFFSQNGNPTYHTSAGENNQAVNATWDEVRLGSGGTGSTTYTGAKWATFYSCNWLTFNNTDGSRKRFENMFQGLRLMTGFASIMFLDSREGTTYGNYLRGGNTIKNAWFAAARKHQVQRDSGNVTVVRVFGYRPAEYDKVTDSVANAPYVSSSPNDFSYWDISIVGTGASI